MQPRRDDDDLRQLKRRPLSRLTVTLTLPLICAGACNKPVAQIRQCGTVCCFCVGCTVPGYSRDQQMSMSCVFASCVLCDGLVAAAMFGQAVATRTQLGLRHGNVTPTLQAVVWRVQQAAVYGSTGKCRCRDLVSAAAVSCCKWLAVGHFGSDAGSVVRQDDAVVHTHTHKKNSHTHTLLRSQHT